MKTICKQQANCNACPLKQKCTFKLTSTERKEASKELKGGNN